MNPASLQTSTKNGRRKTNIELSRDVIEADVGRKQPESPQDVRRSRLNGRMSAELKELKKKLWNQNRN
jgi:hypothetical protein